MTAEMQRMKARDETSKFSLTFDEWTSKKNKRYMNINLHFKNEHRNLGLIRINTSASAENLVRLISERLNLFNLNLENDIISITTDGPNVMKKLGRIVPCLQQFCYAHGLQLAVIDVLYQKRDSEESEVENIEDDPDQEAAEDCESDDDETRIEFETEYRREININYKDVIEKVRKTVKTFKNSPNIPFYRSTFWKKEVNV